MTRCCQGNDTPPADGLFQMYPELAAAISGLSNGAKWALTGVSALLLDRQGRLVLEIVKRKHWRRLPGGVVEVGLGAIGGSLEADERPLDCLQREAHEEIACSPEVLSAGGASERHETILVYEQSKLLSIPLPARDAPRPALFTVSANLYRRDALDAEVLTIATYWARLHETPRLGDIFGLLSVPRESLDALLHNSSLPLQDALALPGIEIATRDALPTDTMLRPVWTVRSLQLVWQASRIVWPEG